MMAMKRPRLTIGHLLRALRARKGWTLKEMSECSGIPLSTLSKVEHDRLTLTFDKLQLLSERLNMSLSELLAEPGDSAEPAVTARRSIGRTIGDLREGSHGAGGPFVATAGRTPHPWDPSRPAFPILATGPRSP